MRVIYTDVKGEDGCGTCSRARTVAGLQGAPDAGQWWQLSLLLIEPRKASSKMFKVHEIECAHATCKGGYVPQER